MRRLATRNYIVAPGGMPVIETTIIITLLSQAYFVFCVFFVYFLVSNASAVPRLRSSRSVRVVVGRAAGMMQFLQRD